MLGRPQGVTIPQGQLNTDRGEPNKVYNIAPVQLFAVEYTDEHGAKHVNITYVLNNVVYMDLNGERWAAGLRQASGYIKDEVLKAARSATAPIPSEDSVDIMPKRTDEPSDRTAAE